MDHRIAATLSTFGTISLDGLNAKAAMLERLDNKYIVPADRLLPAFERFREHFDLLEIEGKRAFAYDTDYFDDADASLYFDHHQNRRKRCKVRIRSYVDAGFSYLEVKLKDGRGGTVKKRQRLPRPELGLGAEERAFIEKCHSDMYGEPLGRDLLSVIRMNYERITLVAREGSERMTIDTRMAFRAATAVGASRDDMFILETKSARGNGIADKILRAEHLQPTKSVSKYCVGMATLGLVRKHNRFLPALRKLEVLAHPVTPAEYAIAAE
ncbi:polyphosphate polymerase domain-containing protein [Profundibacterium mesophilum]|uniref:VTC domain containing protein n=1 Tax=Profundibacterium mesophilum KAUST100406-0324 TaxID=1037889 RepID=A0A921NU83_9RHOB|nr:polyphosphate polymerase domain-containing protein [Profundibacterium mesophilum]KAF0675311.1 VTC domain containing protein [Profundibacterium mesophilum KAUST100406-0324]